MSEVLENLERIEKANLRVLKSILSSYSKGVVPRRGLPYVAVGRANAIESVKDDLDSTADDDVGGVFRFIVGNYGSGKSFMVQLIRTYAIDNNFVVMDADFSPERRFTGSGKEGLNMYRELIKNMSTKTKDGGAMETLLKKWIQGIKEDISHDRAIPLDNVSNYLISQEVRMRTEDITEIPFYTDFINMVLRYWIAHDDKTAENLPLKWLKGEYEQRALARKDLDVGIIIDNKNWYDFIKVWSEFVTSIGYNGLIVFFDQCDVAVKLGKSARDNNYECILQMYNDINQGKATHLSMYACEIPRSLEDPNRGLYSYEALRTRLQPQRFLNGVEDKNGPIMTLTTLSKENVFSLCNILAQIHKRCHDYEMRLTPRMIEDYVGHMFSRLGADEVVYPRDVSRSFISILDTMYENPDTDFYDLVKGLKPEHIEEVDPFAGLTI